MRAHDRSLHESQPGRRRRPRALLVVQAGNLVRDGTAPAANENPLEGIEHLAGVTGGTRLSLVKFGDASLVMVSRATASSYAAVVDAVPSESEGTHQLAVDVSRTGVEVRARSTIFVRKPLTSKPLPRTPPEMVRVADAFTSLQMRVSGFSTLNGTDGQMRIIAAAEAVEAGVLLTALSAALFDNQGRMVARPM